MTAEAQKKSRRKTGSSFPQEDQRGSIFTNSAVDKKGLPLHPRPFLVLLLGVSGFVPQPRKDQESNSLESSTAYTRTCFLSSGKTELPKQMRLKKLFLRFPYSLKWVKGTTESPFFWSVLIWDDHRLIYLIFSPPGLTNCFFFPCHQKWENLSAHLEGIELTEPPVESKLFC